MTTADREPSLRISGGLDTPIPEVQLLSNGRYHVMITSAGGGYSRWRNLAVTRWREDATCDNWGAFCYIRDAASGQVWSTAFQPTLQGADTYEVVFSTGRLSFRRRDGDIETHTEIAVAPADDVELRRVRITNGSLTHRAFDVTSYTEIVLAPPATDAAPYVLASDVYALVPHTGRGGWTWYTGSAGWMYQFILESLLGLRRDADKLHLPRACARTGNHSRCITGIGRPSTTSPFCKRPLRMASRGRRSMASRCPARSFPGLTTAGNTSSR